MQRLKEIIVNIFMIQELRRRFLVTFALLAIFRLGFFIRCWRGCGSSEAMD